MHDIFLEYCTPKVIQCDNGEEFKGPFQSLVSKHRVKKITSRPYHPESEGKCERSHKTLSRKLGFLRVIKKGSNSVSDLARVVHSMNATPVEVLRYQTPFEIYFGRQHEKHTPLHNLSQMTHRVRKNRIDASMPSTYEV